MRRWRGYFSAVTLLITLMLSGCAGIEPYDPPEYKEEPPGSGLLSGEDGNFVIYRKNAEDDTNSEKIQKNNQ